MLMLPPTLKTSHHVLAFALAALAASAAAQTLTHGPFAGAVTSNSARFYLRLAPAGSANVQVSPRLDFSTRLLGQPVDTDPARDYAALIAVEPRASAVPSR